jgi:hypothetical protein
VKDCPECCGRGCVPSDFNWQLVPCPTCKGTGRIVDPIDQAANLPVATSFASASCSIFVGLTPFGHLAEALRARDLPRAFRN